MISYSVFTKTLRTPEPLEELIKSVTQILEKEGNDYWVVAGDITCIYISFYQFTPGYCETSDRIKLLLDVDYDPFVVALTKGSGVNNKFYEILNLVLDTFGGFIDCEGEIISKIYPTIYVDEDGNKYDDEGHDLETGKGNEELLPLIDINKYKETFRNI